MTNRFEVACPVDLHNDWVCHKIICFSPLASVSEPVGFAQLNPMPFTKSTGVRILHRSVVLGVGIKIATGKSGRSSFPQIEVERESAIAIGLTAAGEFRFPNSVPECSFQNAPSDMVKWESAKAADTIVSGWTARIE
ncbi:hypothetical protein [Sphingomonas bacterium]|uniref:hypothetical protein n=1 Tax=Sphingomonas bacterium TaxID=1895847 RepID=UPI001575528C|nr:hypothetical protein [Sphingomonas bacterium]